MDPMTEQAMADIARERKNTSFSIQAMAEYVDGGKDLHNARKLAHNILKRDPQIAFETNPFDLTRAQWRWKTAQQVSRINEIRATLGKTDPLLADAISKAAGELSESLSMKMYVHDMLYHQSIQLFGTPAQIKEFIPKDPRIVGCFAMTELGHSSSLRDLETTATFDPKTNEWIITSPTLTSTKWWIGAAGQSATHTVLVSQTIVNTENHGLSWFIVPLRSLETGRLLPGVTCGDIGAKAGRHGLDNGWIQLTSVRIPLNNMLSKWMQVIPSLTQPPRVSPPPHPAVMYATLIPERISALTLLQVLVGQSVTIASRYGVVRRQGPGNPQIIDFQIQTVNTLPLVAGLYVYMNAERKIQGRWDRLRLEAVQNPSVYLEELPDIHSVSAGFKAVGTWWGSYALETCRRACGGHAYSAYNAIAGHIADWGVVTTGGGDNYTLIQQLARYVMGIIQKVLANKQVACIGSTAFLANTQQILKQRYTFPQDGFKDLHSYVTLFSSLVVKMGADLVSKFKETRKSNSTADVWNIYMVDLTKLGTIFVYQHLFSLYHEGMSDLKNEAISPVLLKCGVLFAADVVRRELLDSVLEYECMTKGQVERLRETVYSGAKELRADVVGLTDAFGFPDFILKAPIGRYDGDIYRHYFETVKNAPDCFKTPYFEDEVKPLLKGRL
ncbi:acyl-Coenzyme A oxidase [Rhizoclosmatium hyalinum]|nr:acyl-Coenzyme A oxidase [Rhizoclosmatium hyalinum]